MQIPFKKVKINVSTDKEVTGIMSQPLLKEEYYTYADYFKWDDGKRWELIEGKPYAMSPAPTWGHQGVQYEIARQLGNFLHGKPCKVFTAPFDVRLNADTGDDTVVQPDIVVICDRSKLIGTGCVGAPDMAVEVLSPSTAYHDTHVKFRLYHNAGVREYWIVNMNTQTVHVYILENGRYYTTSYGNTDVAPVSILEGCEIDLREVFADAGETESQEGS